MIRWISLGAVGIVLATACTIEPLDDPGIGELALTSVVYAADGSILAEFHASENRVLVEYHTLPQSLLDAVVAIEDERFWQHTGVDLQAVARALVANLADREVVQGGSTITQQYLKNVVLTPAVTLDRKLTEAALALRLEQGVDKEVILENYLNTVYFGNSSYGVGAASNRYFGKDVSEIDLAESATLAALIQAPSAYDPYKNPEAAIGRRRIVLEKMAGLGWITFDEAQTADATPLRLFPRVAGEPLRYPYFTEEVKRWLLDHPALGATATDRYNALFRGGLHIYTTLDPLTQEAAEAAIADVIPADGPSAALAAVDPRSGEVRALVGGRDFYDLDDPTAQFNLATQGRRQPGSAFKPFVLATALDQGQSLSAIYGGGPEVEIATDSGPWVVQNYNELAYPDLTLLEATVFSVNVVYAQLVNVVGPQAVADLAAAAGINTPLQGLHSIALGAQEVSPLDMASGFATFAAEGLHFDAYMVTRIETTGGVNLFEAVPVASQVIGRDVANNVTAALTQVVERGTGQQAKIGRPVAGKTGTSQEHRDAWFVGYTPELSAAVWVGYPLGAISMEPPLTPFTVTGGTWPAQVWSRFASVALGGSFELLQTGDTGALIDVHIDTSTGFLAGPFCPRRHVSGVRLPADSVPTVVCPIHNPTGVVEIGSFDLPDVISSSLSAAVTTLNELGFLTTVEWQDGGDLAQGTVFNQFPSPGFPTQTGSVVRLIVAGPEPGSVVPSVLGFPAGQARSELAQIGVGVQLIIEAESNPDDAARRPDVVWKQDPAPGADAQGVVRLWVNP